MDALLSDVRMPYPIMEIWFPPGLYLDNSMEINGALVIDAANFNVQHEIEKGAGLKHIKNIDSNGRSLADYWVLSRIKKPTGQDHNTLIHRFCKDEIIFDDKQLTFRLTRRGISNRWPSWLWGSCSISSVTKTRMTCWFANQSLFVFMACRDRWHISPRNVPTTSFVTCWGSARNMSARSHKAAPMLHRGRTGAHGPAVSAS